MSGLEPINSLIIVGSNSLSLLLLTHTVKKGWRHSRPQPAEMSITFFIQCSIIPPLPLPRTNLESPVFSLLPPHPP